MTLSALTSWPLQIRFTVFPVGAKAPRQFGACKPLVGHGAHEGHARGERGVEQDAVGIPVGIAGRGRGLVVLQIALDRGRQRVGRLAHRRLKIGAAGDGFRHVGEADLEVSGSDLG